jgi:glycosyltransferase involved in cell wall biosynthesis
MNIANPAVSIVITCFNYGHYLAGAIESVLAQTYRNFEVIVIDDGSTDNTMDLMVGLSRHPQVKYIRQNNSGQARAKNAGIIHSRGRFLAFLDADDLWESEKLEKQMPFFADPRVGVVYSRARYIDEKGDILAFKESGKYLQPRSGKVTEHLFLDNFVLFSSSIVRRECLEKMNGFDETLSMGIDWDLWLRLSVVYSFAYAEEPLLLYRTGHAGQMSRKTEERQRCSDRIMAKFLMEHPGLLSPDLIRKAYCYTHLNRGYYFRRRSARRSISHYIAALKCNAWQKRAYLGLIKTCLAGTLRMKMKKQSSMRFIFPG